MVRANTYAEYSYQSMWMSTGTATSQVFEVKAAKDAHILLSTMLSLNTNDGTEISIFQQNKKVGP